MTYKECLNFLYSALPMYQRIGAKAFKKDLTNTLRLLEYLNNPHEEFKSIHIAGTNGKGSSAQFISQILIAQGYKVGLYTSPHLKRFTERIQINSQEIPEDDVVRFVTTIKPAIKDISPSFFEITVALAFWYFQQQGIDIAVVETGLGGRLDSTNVLNPEVCLITNIGYDHQDMLGDSLEEIAYEKAGIIKENTPIVLCADQSDVEHIFEKVAQKRNSRLSKSYLSYQIEVLEQSLTQTTIKISKDREEWLSAIVIPNGADYLISNIPGVLGVVEQLNGGPFKISHSSIIQGLQNFRLKGRMQVLSPIPLMIADISHNEPGLKYLLNQIEEQSFKNIHFIIGFVKDKKMDKLLSFFPLDGKYYFTQSDVPRSMSAIDLQQLASEQGLRGDNYENVNQAIKKVKKLAEKDDLILICGSTFVVAEIEEL